MGESTAAVLSTEFGDINTLMAADELRLQQVGDVGPVVSDAIIAFFREPHNQKLVQKHDIALEQRLLDAGLSPETIALYERILEVADVRQMDIISPPTITDQYQHKSSL